MKYLEKFNIFKKEDKDPIIGYKEVDGKYYKQNPSGGQWVVCTKQEFLDNKNYEVSPGVFARKRYNK